MNKEFMALVHVKDDVYLVDREAYYLCCSLQQVKFAPNNGDDYDYKRIEAKRQMYALVLAWFIENGKAIKLDCKQSPIHLIIELDEKC